MIEEIIEVLEDSRRQARDASREYYTRAKNGEPFLRDLANRYRKDVKRRTKEINYLSNLNVIINALLDLHDVGD